MATRRLSGLTTSSSVPDNGGDHSGGGGSAGGYGDDIFSTDLWVGDSTSEDVVNGVDLDGKGGMVWVKVRSRASSHHCIADTERGLLSTLYSDQNWKSDSQPEIVTSFNSDGFSVGNVRDANGSMDDMVSWTFRKARSFFDVVTYTGDGTSDLSYKVPHNLGCQPGLVIFKNVSANSDWLVWTERCWGSGHNLILNENNAESASNEANGRGYVENGGNYDLTPVAMGTGVNANKLNDEYVAYVFAHDDSDESMIKCGGYKSTNSTEEIELGWEPQFLLIKCASVGGAGCNWQLLDCMRGLGETSTASVIANTEDKEYDVDPPMAVATAKGFKLVTNSGSNTNSPGDYIYMAIRRPNKPASEFEADELFVINGSVNGVTNPAYRTSPEWPVDFSLFRAVSSAFANTNAASRLTAPNFLKTNLSEAEEALAESDWDYMNGWRSTAPANQTAWMWRRAPGFFDVVCYEGNSWGGSTSVAIPHSLAAVPQMLWIKKRTGTNGWQVYNHKMAADPRSAHMQLQGDYGAMFGSYERWAQDFTEEAFFIGGDSDVNEMNQSYLAYLFASVPGICDIGTYTGDTSTNSVMVDCGFTNGPRFVLIKRTDANGDWMYWDSLRGLGFSGNPMLKLNDTDAQVANDYIQAESYGFRARKGEPTNIDGAEYIYMAIA